MTDQHSSLEQASPWVARFAPLIRSGEVLDLACGAGRHAKFLAARGLKVLAVDRDTTALQQLGSHGIATLQIDLETGDAAAGLFDKQRFAGIVVTNYLHRPLFSKMFASLAPNGVLIYETFAQGNERFGKPSNPDFLLKPGELLTLVQLQGSMRIIAFEEGYIEKPKPAIIQRLCVVKANEGTNWAAFPLF